MPNPTYTLKTIDGSEKDIFMSFGLMNAITRVVGNVDNVASLVNDHDARDQILVELLSERTKGGKVVNKAVLDEIDLDYNEVLSLLTWAQEHMVDFFMKSLTGVKNLVEANKEKIQDLVSFLTGSAASPSGTPSVGS